MTEQRKAAAPQDDPAFNMQAAGAPASALEVTDEQGRPMTYWGGLKKQAAPAPEPAGGMPEDSLGEAHFQLNVAKREIQALQGRVRELEQAEARLREASEEAKRLGNEFEKLKAVLREKDFQLGEIRKLIGNIEHWFEVLSRFPDAALADPGGEGEAMNKTQTPKTAEAFYQNLDQRFGDTAPLLHEALKQLEAAAYLANAADNFLLERDTALHELAQAKAEMRAALKENRWLSHYNTLLRECHCAHVFAVGEKMDAALAAQGEQKEKL